MLNSIIIRKFNQLLEKIRRPTDRLFNPQFSNTQSFTLVELLVVIAITGMISGLIIANLRTGREIKDLGSDIEKLAGIIKQAQMMALSGKYVGDSRPEGGYGVYLTANSYKLFADINSVDNHQYNDGADTIIQNFTFTDSVTASSFTYDYIIFKPPKGNIYVGDVGEVGVELESTNTNLIVLKHAVNRYAYVEINAQGQIDVRKTQ